MSVRLERAEDCKLNRIGFFRFRIRIMILVPGTRCHLCDVLQ